MEQETKTEKTTSDFPIIKVQLPREAAIKVQSALLVLRERKADTKADELIAEFLDGVTEEYLDSQIEKRTPEDYYFEAAKSIPELREKIIQQTKKALQKTDRPPLSIPAVEPKKPRKKEKTADFQASEKPVDFQVLMDAPEIAAPEMTQ